MKVLYLKFGINPLKKATPPPEGGGRSGRQALTTFRVMQAHEVLPLVLCVHYSVFF